MRILNYQVDYLMVYFLLLFLFYYLRVYRQHLEIKKHYPEKDNVLLGEGLGEPNPSP